MAGSEWQAEPRGVHPVRPDVRARREAVLVDHAPIGVALGHKDVHPGTRDAAGFTQRAADCTQRAAGCVRAGHGVEGLIVAVVEGLVPAPPRQRGGSWLGDGLGSTEGAGSFDRIWSMAAARATRSASRHTQARWPSSRTHSQRRRFSSACGSWICGSLSVAPRSQKVCAPPSGNTSSEK